MNIVRNDRLIKRNSAIAKFTMLGGLGVLGAGMFISFKYPEQVTLSFGALLLGFLLSQIGIFFSNRWGRRPRPDELLDGALKGLDSKNALYHYRTPASHVLVGPAGVWVLLPFYQRGTISFAKGRWRQKGGNPYLKLFAQESLGRPDLEVNNEIDRLNDYLKKRLGEESAPPVNAVLVFTHEGAKVEIPETETPPAETIHAKDLKEFMRKKAKAKGNLSTEKVAAIQGAFDSEG